MKPSNQVCWASPLSSCLCNLTYLTNSLSLDSLHSWLEWLTQPSSAQPYQLLCTHFNTPNLHNVDLWSLESVECTPHLSKTENKIMSNSRPRLKMKPGIEPSSLPTYKLGDSVGNSVKWKSHSPLHLEKALTERYPLYKYPILSPRCIPSYVVLSDLAYMTLFLAVEDLVQCAVLFHTKFPFNFKSKNKARSLANPWPMRRPSSPFLVAQKLTGKYFTWQWGERYDFYSG